MSANTWAVVKECREGSEVSVPSTDGGASKSRICPFDPSLLAFDYKRHTAVELGSSDQLFGLVMAHLGKHGVILEKDAISFRMTKAENGGGRQSGHGGGGGCGGCGEVGHTASDGGHSVSEQLKSVSVSLGLGLFRFSHRGRELKVLHQNVGDPVGTGCGPSVLSNLIIFREGVGTAATQDIREFLAEIVAESEKTTKNTFQVYRWHIKYQFWQRVSRCVARPVSSVVLPDKTSESLVRDLSEFLSEETAQFYQDHGIPYKRSYLFYGVPGSGKTSMIQALAGRYGRNLCYLSPTHPELSDDCLKSAIEKVPQNAIVVLEDVDALFGKGREKKIQQSPLTFSGLLNALDGVGNHDGMVFVLTTNFKEQLDDALIRDGRVDMRVHFDYCTPEQMEKLFDNFYPPKVSATLDDNADLAAEAGKIEVDPEIAALEARLAALKKAKATAAEGNQAEAEAAATEAVPNGAAFRDSLLVALGSHKLSAAQLQSFFVTHRKCSAAEAIADVSSIVKAIEKRAEEEEAAKEPQKVSGEADDSGKKGSPATVEGGHGVKTQSKTSSGDAARTVHVHIHSAD